MSIATKQLSTGNVEKSSTNTRCWISCPTRYFPEASSINFSRSVKYGFGVLWTSLRFLLQKWGVSNFAIFDKSERGLVKRDEMPGMSLK